MARPEGDRLGLEDTAEETTRAETEWAVPELYRVDSPESTSSLGDPEAVLATTARRPPRRPPLPSRHAGLVLSAALVAIALIASIPFLLSRLEPASEAGESSPQPAVTDTELGSRAAAPPGTQLTASASAGTSKVEVPDVQGASIAAARRALREAGLEVKAQLADSHRPDGAVLAQDPRAGVRVPRASAVVLTVSSGPPDVSVPDVVGLRADEAGRLLRRAGLRVAVRLVRTSDEAGVVVAQRPAGETSQRHGALVRLDVAEAAPEPRTVRVPRLEGLQLDRAKARLRARGLRWTVDEVPSSRPRGVVVGQSDRPGEVVERGTRIVLEVSSGPALQSVPDVVGLDVVHAREQLEAAGFVVLVLESPTTDPAEDGIVLDQSPGGGTRAREGTEVTLHVGLAG